MKSQPAVLITQSAVASIAREACRSVDGLETGGILLGTDDGGVIVIKHAGDPGPEAKRSERAFVRDNDHARRLANEVWVLDGSQWIGEWHTHPNLELIPSSLDLNSYFRHLRDPELGLERFVAIIVGVGSDVGVVASAWTIDSSSASMVELNELADEGSGE